MRREKEQKGEGGGETKERQIREENLIHKRKCELLRKNKRIMNVDQKMIN